MLLWADIDKVHQPAPRTSSRRRGWKRDSRTPHPWYSLKSTQPSTPTATPMQTPSYGKSAANAASKWYSEFSRLVDIRRWHKLPLYGQQEISRHNARIVDQLQRGTNRNSCRRQDRCIPCRRHTCGIRRQQRCRNGELLRTSQRSAASELLRPFVSPTRSAQRSSKPTRTEITP